MSEPKTSPSDTIRSLRMVATAIIQKLEQGGYSDEEKPKRERQVKLNFEAADTIRQLEDELAAWRQAADDQDLDCCQCQCGRWVIQVPDGMVLCGECAEKESETGKPGLDRAGIERVIGQKGVPVGGGFGGLKLAETASAVAKPKATRWQPIETAPKDGKEVLLSVGLPSDWTATRACVAKWVYTEWCDPHTQENIHGVPTHWTHLPNPPTKKETE